MRLIIQELIVHAITQKVNSDRPRNKEFEDNMREIVHIQAGQCGNQVTDVNQTFPTIRLLHWVDFGFIFW